MKSVVIIPTHKEKLSGIELECFKNNIEKMKNHTICLVCPEHFDTSFYGIDYVERFDDEYFKSIEGYNLLMIQKEFYERFINYDYMLIMHTDSYVFKDELDYWCDKDYDYIGAPWAGFSLINQIVGDIKDKIGNGGFSLRKIKSFIEDLNTERAINLYNKGVPEDLIFAFNSNFNFPSCKEACMFSIENNPTYCFELTNYTKPFGSHQLYKFNYNLFERLKIDKIYNRSDNMKKLCIVIPVYKETLDVMEVISLKRYWEVIGNKYDVYFVRPNKEFNMEKYYNLIPGWEEHVFEKTFDESYFKSTATYSQLCINSDFYKEFSEYEYMYIYQLDCYINRDELEYWCNQGYDYIGSPILSTDCGWSTVVNGQYIPRIGNGGFSLRKIKTFIEITDPEGEYRKYYKITDEYLKNVKYEDLYFCEEVYSKYKFNVPYYKNVIGFCWDMSADILFEHMGYKELPMCIHAFDKNIRFWRKHIEEMNNQELIDYCEKKYEEFFKLYYDENDSSLR